MDSVEQRERLPVTSEPVTVTHERISEHVFEKGRLVSTSRHLARGDGLDLVADDEVMTSPTSARALHEALSAFWKSAEAGRCAERPILDECGQRR